MPSSRKPLLPESASPFSLEVCAKRAAECRALDDVGLIARIAAHDRVAFAEIYHRFARAVLPLVRRCVRSDAEARVVLPRAFSGVWEHAWHYRPAMGTALRWAAVLAQHCAIAWLQAHGRRREAAEEVWRMAIEDTLVGARARVAPGHAGWPLSSADRLALELAFFDGLTRTETARVLGVSRRVIEARIRRGLVHLEAQAAAATGSRLRPHSRGSRDVHRTARAIAGGQRSAA